MFPKTFTEQITETAKEEKTDTGIDFLFDYNTGQHIIKGSTLVNCQDLQKVRQYVENVLRTPANLYKDYIKGEKEAFGLSIYNYIGQRTLPIGYINSELKREVTEHLLKYPLISEVKDWKGEREKRGLNVSFTVVLNDGNTIDISHKIGDINV